MILTAGVPSSQALPGFLITATPSVCVPHVLGVLVVWIQNQKKQRESWNHHMAIDEDVEALRCADTPIAQVHSRAGCMRATFFPAGVRLSKHAPVAETVRSFGSFCSLSGDLVWWKMASGEVEMARPTPMRMCIMMHGQALYTADEYICRLSASCEPSAGCCTVHGPRMKRALDDKFGACHRHDDKLCRPVAAKPCGPCGSRCLPHRGVRFA